MKTVSPVRLEDGSRIGIVGGGPAGSFFAIDVLRRAKAEQRSIHVTIIEKKRESRCQDSSLQPTQREGCNYCAGIISPRMFDVLKETGLALPDDVINGNITALTVQGEWKHIVLDVPAGRRMVVVYRGSKPWGRQGRYSNLDSFLLDRAAEEGADVIAGEVQDLHYAESGKTVLHYSTPGDKASLDQVLETDFTVLACGVNQIPGMKLENARIFSNLQGIIPRFRPPRTRKALIAEVDVKDERFMRRVQDELFIAEYGSRDLSIEMASLIPKGKFMTVVLIGPTVDRCSGGSQSFDIINRFLELPHIRRLLPRGSAVASACMCNPNMTVGVAREPVGRRVAVIGDMATSRLYKDGIHSAHRMASALAGTVMDLGVDRKSLRRGYLPVVRDLTIDNRFGRLVFLINRMTFRSRILGRVLYQAVLIERKTRPENKRRLEQILWKIASGEDSYKSIMASMLHPGAIRSILVGGWLVTLRNSLTEQFFGLKWRGFGRYPTGVTRDKLRAKREKLIEALQMTQLARGPDFEKMYSIGIVANKKEILRQLGRFGEDDRKYFKPKMITVRRIAGKANEVGCVIRYEFPFLIPPVDLVLEDMVGERFLVFRVMNSFARGGVLIFDLEETRKEDYLLSVYVAFDFQGRAGRMLRYVFPSFLHDVVWNHSLCLMKDVIDRDLDPPVVERG